MVGRINDSKRFSNGIYIVTYGFEKKNQIRYRQDKTSGIL